MVKEKKASRFKLKEDRRQKRFTKKTFSEYHDSRYLISEVKSGLEMQISDKSKEFIDKKFKQGVYIGPVYFKYNKVDIPVGLTYITISGKTEEIVTFNARVELSKTDLPFNIVELKNGKPIKVEYSFMGNLDCYVNIPKKFIKKI